MSKRPLPPDVTNNGGAAKRARTAGEERALRRTRKEEIAQLKSLFPMQGTLNRDTFFVIVTEWLPVKWVHKLAALSWYFAEHWVEYLPSAMRLSRYPDAPRLLSQMTAKRLGTFGRHLQALDTFPSMPRAVRIGIPRVLPQLLNLRELTLRAIQETHIACLPPLLTSVTLINSATVDIAAFNGLNHLKRLRLTHCELTNRRQLTALHIPALSHLSLRAALPQAGDRTGPVSTQLQQAVAPQLISLDITPAMLNTATIPQFTALESLTLENTVNYATLSDEAAYHLSALPRLRCLTLQMNQYAAGTAMRARHVSWFTRVEVLDLQLAHSRDGPPSFSIQEALQPLVKLRSLCITMSSELFGVRHLAVGAPNSAAVDNRSFSNVFATLEHLEELKIMNANWFHPQSLECLRSLKHLTLIGVPNQHLPSLSNLRLRNPALVSYTSWPFHASSQ